MAARGPDSGTGGQGHELSSIRVSPVPGPRVYGVSSAQPGEMDALGSLGRVCVSVCVYMCHCVRARGVTPAWGHAPCHRHAGRPALAPAPGGSLVPCPANFGQPQAAPNPVPSLQWVMALRGDIPVRQGQSWPQHRARTISGLSRLAAHRCGTHSPSHVSTHWRWFRFLFLAPPSSF